MIKKIIVVMAFVFVLFGCANDNTYPDVATKEYRVADASELNIFQFERRKNIVVTLLEGEEQKIVFKTEEKLLSYLNCEVIDNVLSIHGNDNQKYDGSLFEIQICGYSFNKIKLENAQLTGNANTIGGDDIEMDLKGASSISINHLEANSISIKETGASEVEINKLVVDKVLTDLKGASKVNLSGSANSLDLALANASTGLLRNLVANTANITVATASELELTVKEKIEGKASDASTIKYFNYVPLVDVLCTSASTISKK